MGFLSSFQVPNQVKNSPTGNPPTHPCTLLLRDERAPVDAMFRSEVSLSQNYFYTLHDHSELHLRSLGIVKNMALVP